MGIIAGLQNISKRASLANPDDWLVNVFLAGAKSKAGVVVNDQAALSCAPVYAAIRVLAESVASLPLITYARLQIGGGKQRATNHYLYPLLHDQPNPEMTAFTFKETLMTHLLLRGNAYAYIVRNRGGEVTELWPLRVDRMLIKREDKKLKYYYRLLTGQELKLEAEEVFHIPGLSYDGVIGYSPLTLFREAIGLAIGAEEYGARFFDNNAVPGLILEHPGSLKPDAFTRLKKSWEEGHKGLEHAHKLAILEEGMKVSKIGLTNKEAQFLELRKFQVTDVARIYRVPPHMIGDLERATFSNIEHQAIDFVVHSLRPWLVRWEQAIMVKLLMPEERKRYFVEFLVDALLRGDILSRYQAYAIGRQNGWFSADDILELENRNPLPDDKGKIYLQPLNMVPAGTPPEPKNILPEEKRGSNGSNTSPSYRDLGRGVGWPEGESQPEA